MLDYLGLDESSLFKREQPPQLAGRNNLGYLSGIGESNNDPGIISSGIGDIGGKSYGAFQFASSIGIPLDFVRWLENHNGDMHIILINVSSRRNQAMKGEFE
jgi:hypothetical protein